MATDRDSRTSADPIRFVFCGSLVDYKGVDILLKALGHDCLRNLPWHLTLIGDGPERAALGAQAAAAGIQKRITFRGTVPLGAAAADYRDGDVLVLPSRFDGWGAVVNEAMEHGLAVVASDAVGSAGMLLEEGENGVTFPSENVDRLVAIISRLITNPKLTREMGQASRRRITQFRPQEAARRTAALCRGLAGHAPMPEFEHGFCSWPP